MKKKITLTPKKKKKIVLKKKPVKNPEKKPRRFNGKIYV